MAEERDNGLAIAELKGQIRALEERMETKQAEYRTDISILAEKLSENIGRLEKDAAKRDKETALRDKETALRDKDNLRWTVGLAIACTTIILGAMAVMLTLPTN
ncbi:MAG: hypothetical protein OXE94_13535 [Aestuariivita sp.]|nr:hypothetical protein [Aestuariivita sp.]MCY4203039.1 hypothetical protein [Aestuariivita sp.]MCY4346889.1 hypothetical protein [Aestuariivita sp.]